MFTEERRKCILDLLSQKDTVLVNALCEQFNVSTATIRTDLRELELQGLLHRTHGGAISNHAATYEQTYTQKIPINVQAKTEIAKAAADLIADNATIALDTGTTVACMVPFLTTKKKLTVLTSDIRIASMFESSNDVTILLAGGVLRNGFSCTMGSITNEFLSQFRLDMAFMATNALSQDGRLSTPNVEQACVKKTLMGLAAHRVLLCDKSKFDRCSLVEFGTLGQFERLITDADEKTVSRFYEEFSDTVFQTIPSK